MMRRPKGLKVDDWIVHRLHGLGRITAVQRRQHKSRNVDHVHMYVYFVGPSQYQAVWQSAHRCRPATTEEIAKYVEEKISA